MVVLALFFTAMVMMMVAILFVLKARRDEQISLVNRRLEALAFLSNVSEPVGATASASLLTALERWTKRVGIPVSPGTAALMLCVIVLGGIVLLNAFGAMAAAIWWGVLSFVSIVVPQVRYRQKINKLVSQIPLFIDQVVRGLVTGRNVEGAIKLAAEDLQEPLRDLIARAHKNVELGMDLGEALRDAASLYEVKELHMLALAIHTSRVYGGSPRDMLESVVSLIRQSEQMQRELRALTGETRFSAVVLGLLPTAIGTFMTSLNPAMFLSMWQDPSGRNILLVALGMQLVGGLLMWRMVKSV